MTKIHSTASSIAISIVSHGQLHLIKNALEDLRNFTLHNTSIVLTINIEEDTSILTSFSDLPISVIKNDHPKGFGDNHNCAFNSTTCDYFIVMNPDLRLTEFATDLLLSPFEDPDTGAVAPVVLSPSGSVEDSVRRFPSLARLLRRVVLRQRQADYQRRGDKPIDVDWAAGMFVVYRAEAFKRIGGFDTRYFMYMEDADICRRLKMSGWRTVLQPACSVIHDAQRASHRSFRHLRWHLTSAFRFLFLPVRQQLSRS